MEKLIKEKESLKNERNYSACFYDLSKQEQQELHIFCKKMSRRT